MACMGDYSDEDIRLMNSVREECYKEEFKFLGDILSQIPNTMWYASIIGCLGERRKQLQKRLSKNSGGAEDD